MFLEADAARGHVFRLENLGTKVQGPVMDYCPDVMHISIPYFGIVRIAREGGKVGGGGGGGGEGEVVASEGMCKGLGTPSKAMIDILDGGDEAQGCSTTDATTTTTAYYFTTLGGDGGSRQVTAPVTAALSNGLTACAGTARRRSRAAASPPARA